jgi:hypothetical protein
MDDCVIYDFETLGQDQQKSCIVSFAMITFSEKHYISDPYAFEELVERAHFIKFDVEDQINRYHRKINEETISWWNSLGPEVRKQIMPSPDDKKLSELYDFIKSRTSGMSIKKVYTRGNTFDPMFLQYAMSDIGRPDPFSWRVVRDTRSMIEGMSFGMDLRNDYIPSEVVDKFVKHDPRQDVALDIMRMQLLAQAILQ